MLYQLHFLIKNRIIGLVINIVVIEMRLDKAFVYGEQEFAKLHAFCAHVTNIARCLCFLHVYIPMYLCALIYYMPYVPSFFMCLCAYMPIYIFHAYAPLYDYLPNYFVPKSPHFSHAKVPTTTQDFGIDTYPADVKFDEN